MNGDYSNGIHYYSWKNEYKKLTKAVMKIK